MTSAADLDVVRLIRLSCAIDALAARSLYDEAMRAPPPEPRTPEAIALERCRQAGVLIPPESSR